MTQHLGELTLLSGNITSGEMTFGWHDQLPWFLAKAITDIWQQYQNILDQYSIVVISKLKY